jgi:prefoldin subunit 5
MIGLFFSTEKSVNDWVIFLDRKRNKIEKRLDNIEDRIDRMEEAMFTVLRLK